MLSKKNFLYNAYNKRIKSIRIIKPGYINFSIKMGIKIKMIIYLAKYGRKCRYLKYKKAKNILIEILSANPTGPIHIGHARSIFIADSIVNLYKIMGYGVNREYYVNNIGRQIILLGNSVYYKFLYIINKFNYIDNIRVYYQNCNINRAVRFFIYNIKLKYKVYNFLKIKKVLKTINYSVINILKTLVKNYVKINQLFEENILYQNFNIIKVLIRYKIKNILYYKNTMLKNKIKKIRDSSQLNIYYYMKKGGLFLKTTNFGDSEDRIILRYNNSPVYLLADIAYHQNKISRNYYKIINILGADHIKHIDKLFYSLHGLSIESQLFVDNILIQMVNFQKNGKNIIFSKRNNNTYALDKLIKKINIKYIKINFLFKSNNTHLNIDINKIIKNIYPFHAFCLLKHVERIKKVLQYLRNNKFVDIYIKNHIFLLYLFKKNNEIHLLKQVMLYFYTIETSFLKYESHLLLFFINKLSHKLHNYYICYRNCVFLKICNFRYYMIKMHMLIIIEKVIIHGLTILNIPYF